MPSAHFWRGPCVAFLRMPATKTVAILAMLPSALFAQSLLPQREQTEQIRTSKLALDQEWRGAKIGGLGPSESTGTDDAFGAQVILKDRPDTRAFQASLETAAFYTDNVALARRGKQGDSFLNSTLALGWRRSLTDRLSASLNGRYGLFRYNQFSVLDFQSLSVDATLGYRLPGQVDIFTGYGYAQFSTRQGYKEFYREHGWNVGVQRIFQLSRAHAIVAGISAQWTWAAPEAAQRDRYSAFFGYHLQATEKLSADIIYRYLYFDFRDASEGRGDSNHSLALALRYDATEWLSITGTMQGIWNRSSESFFNYDAMNVGGSVGLNARF